MGAKRSQDNQHKQLITKCSQRHLWQRNLDCNEINETTIQTEIKYWIDLARVSAGLTTGHNARATKQVWPDFLLLITIAAQI